MYVHAKGKGPTVLFVHGFLGSSFSWRHQSGTIAANGFSVLAPDLPGFGDAHSPWETDHSHLAYAEECATVLRKEGNGPAHVVGHSMGGTVAAWIAIRYPELVASLTLVDPAIYGAPFKLLARVPGLTHLACWLLKRRWSKQRRFVRDLARFYGAPVGQEVLADYWRRYRREENQRGAIAHIRDGSGPSVLPHLGEVRAPVYIIWGEQDAVFPVRQAQQLAVNFRRAPGGPRLTLLPGAGHFPMETNPQPFNQQLLAYLQRIGSLSSGIL